MGSVLQGFFPLPVWRFPFQPGVFARGAASGLRSFLATLYLYGARYGVTPVTAIPTGFLATRAAAWRRLGRIPIPGRTTAQLPFRNVRRAPRRTLMTVLGVAAAIMVVIGLVGVFDSFGATIDDADAEGESAARIDNVELDLSTRSPPSRHAIEQSPAARAAEADLELPSTLRDNGRRSRRSGAA
jgi:putative ABC transport system permease protein